MIEGPVLVECGANGEDVLVFRFFNNEYKISCSMASDEQIVINGRSYELQVLTDDIFDSQADPETLLRLFQQHSRSLRLTEPEQDNV